jgi:hypothetical protein
VRTAPATGRTTAPAAARPAPAGAPTARTAPAGPLTAASQPGDGR